MTTWAPLHGSPPVHTGSDSVFQIWRVLPALGSGLAP